MGTRKVVLLLVLCASACATPPPPPPPDPPPEGPFDFGALALKVRPVVEEVLGAPVPEAAAVPVEASREELEADLVVELRPQVDRLYPDATPHQRDTVLRLTARSSSLSVIARYSAARGRIFIAPANVVPQMEAAGLAATPPLVRAFASAVLAHEMVHAVDDAAAGLARLFREAPDAESMRALGMVLEGRAVHYSRRVAERLGLPAEATAVLPGARGPLDERRARFLLTYREGAAFTAALEGRGGRELAARPLADPPRLTSTLFHPSRYGLSGEERGPDLAALLVAAGFPGAAAASELDLRARWLPVLGEEATARAFRGYVAGAGEIRADGGVSVSVHESGDAAQAYEAALRSLYEREATDGLSYEIVRDGPSVASGVDRSNAEAGRDAERALAASRNEDSTIRR